MIPTWLHGYIDYSVSGLFGGAGFARSLSPAVRRTFGSAGAYHASYSAVTDYEAGVRPYLTMRQHLALDAVGATALCAAGLLMRRQPGGQRALLVAAGLAEFAVIAASDQTSGQISAAPTTESVSYPPLDTLKSVADDVFIVDSTLPGLMGKTLAVRMTVIRLPDGSLLLHSPTRFTRQLQAELERLGPVAHLVAPNVAHWTLLKPWQEAFPQAKTYAAPGLQERRQVQRSGLQFDAELGGMPPAAWGDAIELTTVPGGFGFHEVTLFHRPSRTLVLTDLVLNLEPSKVPAWIRPIVNLFGSTTPDGMPPPYLRAVIRMRHAASASAARKLVSYKPERVIFSHGLWFDTDATEHLRRSLRWLLH